MPLLSPALTPSHTHTTGTPAVQVKNDSEVPLLVVCSQLTPLHWGRVEPGETFNPGNVLNMGRVWFTVSVSVYDERNVPTLTAVVASIVALSASIIFLAGPAYFVALAATLGIASVKGASLTGVYADGKTLLVRGARCADSVYALTLMNADGAAPADPPAPPAAEEAGAAAAPAVSAGVGGGAGAMPSV